MKWTKIDDSVNLHSPSPSPQGLTNDDEVGVQNVDEVSGSLYTSSKLQIDGQPLKSGNDSGKAGELSEVSRGLPSNDDFSNGYNCIYWFF